MTGNIPLSSKGKIGKTNVIKDVKDEVDELIDSYSSKYIMRVFDLLCYGKDGVLPLSKFVDLIEILREVFHSEDITSHLRKLDPNESGSFDCFAFVRWYVDKEVSLGSTEEAEHLVGGGCKVRLIDLQ